MHFELIVSNRRASNGVYKLLEIDSIPHTSTFIGPPQFQYNSSQWLGGVVAWECFEFDCESLISLELNSLDITCKQELIVSGLDLNCPKYRWCVVCIDDAPSVSVMGVVILYWACRLVGTARNCFNLLFKSFHCGHYETFIRQSTLSNRARNISYFTLRIFHTRLDYSQRTWSDYETLRSNQIKIEISHLYLPLIQIQTSVWRQGSLKFAFQLLHVLFIRNSFKF